MKVNKIIIIVCLSMSIISGVSFVFYRDDIILQSILSGIFTGFIVSLVVAIIEYFHDQAKIIELVEENIKSLFLNIRVMSEMLGQILPQIHNSIDIPNLPFENIYGLSRLNPEFIEKMNLGLYSPIFPKSKKAIVCKDLKAFQETAYNIKNRSSNIAMQVLNYNILLLEIRTNHMMGMQPDPIKERNMDNLKNLINISTAKFHEYTTAQSLEIAKISKNFFGDKVWNDIKNRLLGEVEYIVNGR